MFGGSYFGGRYFGGAFFGKAGLSVPGYYSGTRYLGASYFGSRYFGSQGDFAPFTLEVTSGLAAAGVAVFGTAGVGVGTLHTVTISQGLQAVGSAAINVASIVPDFTGVFELNAPLQLAAVGSAVISATIGLIIGGAPGVGRYFGGTFFGGGYFGRSYFGTGFEHVVVLTAPLAAAGTVSFSVSPGQDLSFAPSTLAAVGSATFQTTLSLGTFTINVTRGLEASGIALIAADVAKTLSGELSRRISTAQGSRRLDTAQGSRSLKVRRS